MNKRYTVYFYNAILNQHYTKGQYDELTDAITRADNEVSRARQNVGHYAYVVNTATLEKQYTTTH